MASNANLCPNLKVDIATLNDPLKTVSTLFHMATVKIASQLWATKNIRDKAAKLFKSLKPILQSNFMHLSLTVEKRAEKLPLPDTLVTHLRYVTSRLAGEIFKWMVFEVKLASSFVFWNYFHCIRWTSRGRIDAMKTAEVLLSQHGVDEEYRREASRYYCFKLDGETLLDLVNYRDGYLLRKYWDSFPEETRTKFLRSLSHSTIDPKNCDLLCFLLSQMTKALRITNMSLSYDNILAFLEDWLCQEYAFEVFLLLFPTMNSVHLCVLVRDVAEMITQDHHSSKQKEFLIKILQFGIPRLTSTEWISDFLFNTTLIILFAEENMDIIEFMLSVVPPDEKVNHLKSLVDLIEYNRYNNLEVLKFAVNRVFATPTEIEEHFLNDDYYFELMKDIESKQTLRSFIEIFLSDKEKVQALELEIKGTVPCFQKLFNYCRYAYEIWHTQKM